MGGVAAGRLRERPIRREPTSPRTAEELAELFRVVESIRFD